MTHGAGQAHTHRCVCNPLTRNTLGNAAVLALHHLLGLRSSFLAANPIGPVDAVDTWSLAAHDASDASEEFLDAGSQEELATVARHRF